MKNITIIFFFLINNLITLIGQETFSKMYDFDETAKQNYNQPQTFGDIGSTWTFEIEEGDIRPGDVIIDFGTQQVTDSITTGGQLKYLLNAADTFYTEGSKVFFWDRDLESYEMYFDFDETSQYDIRYWDFSRREEQIATVMIDSISKRLIAGDSIQVQHVTVLNSGTYDPYKVDVYENIGASDSGIKFILGEGLFDNNSYATKLRCFSNDIVSYNFVGYACDSAWTATSTILETLNHNIKIYPNPTTREVFIEGTTKEVNYKIYSINGELLDKGITKSHKIHLSSTGMRIIKLLIDGEWVIKKIVKIE